LTSKIERRARSCPLWLFTAPHNFELLVIERGWTLDAFRAWITRQLIAALV
jgi:hypothetical protein